MSQVDVIIPLGKMAEGKSVRERLDILRFALNTAYGKCSNVRVIVVCQDVPEAERALRGTPCRLVQIHGHTFNKGWCLNVGVKHSQVPYVCIAESDMWFRGPFLGEVPAWMKRSRLQWCFGWQSLFYLNRQETQDLVGHAIRPQARPSAVVQPQKGYSEGGLVFFQREFYWRIGGSSEWFQELGGPDNDLAFRARHVSHTYVAYPSFVYHLYHPKVKQRRSKLRAENISYLRYTQGHPDPVIKTMRAMNAGNPKEPYCVRQSFAGARKRVCG